jgi:hypothetical protein
LPTLIVVHGAWVRDAPWWSQMTEPDGTVGVHADLVRELFLQDCDEAGVQQALDRLTHQSATPFAPATPTHRLAAQAPDVLPVHRGPRHPR